MKFNEYILQYTLMYPLRYRLHLIQVAHFVRCQKSPMPFRHSLALSAVGRFRQGQTSFAIVAASLSLHPVFEELGHNQPGYASSAAVAKFVAREMDDS